MKKTKFPPLVVIDWVDSFSHDPWTYDVQMEEEDKRCRTVGWLVWDGKDSKTIASSITYETPPQKCLQMTIPIRAITKLKVLQK